MKRSQLILPSLGMMYELGSGVEQNFNESFKWFLKAANQGADIAQYNVGKLTKSNLQNGIGGQTFDVDSH